MYRDRKRAALASIKKPVRRPPSARTYTWTCEYCGQPFTTSNYSQRYCKPYHKKLAYQVRKAENGETGSTTAKRPDARK